MPEFKALKLLGSGGFATVEEISWRSTYLGVAKKTVRLVDGQDPPMEVATLQRIRHPHIIRLLDTIQYANRVSYFLSPVADTDLAQYLSSAEKLGSVERAQYLRTWSGCLSSAIYHTHAKDFIHMDIQPANILVVNEKPPKVLLAETSARL